MKENWGNKYDKTANADQGFQSTLLPVIWARCGGFSPDQEDHCEGAWRRVFLTRAELVTLFKKAGVDTQDIRMNFLMMDAELEGLICSGPRRGKQFTYALMAGIWRRELGKGKVVVEVQLFEPVSQVVRRLIGREAERFGRFLGVEATGLKV